MRRRSPSYSPPPRRGRGRSRSLSPRGRYPPRKEPPTSLLVRNLPRNCRAEDLRGPFKRFGPLRDIYLPKDYYTGEPRGFGFVQYLDPYDAEEAQYHMNHQILCGRELTVIFAEENRKKPYEMRNKERPRSRGFSEDNGRVYHRDRSRSYSRSRTPPRWHRYSRSPDERSHHYSPSGSRSRPLSPGRHHSVNRTNERSSGSQSRKYMERPPSGSPVNSHRYSGSRSRERSSSYGDDSSGERYSKSPSS